MATNRKNLTGSVGGIEAWVQKIVRKAVAAERRRCANIAARWKSPLQPGTEARLLGHQEAAREIARAIRDVNG